MKTGVKVMDAMTKAPVIVSPNESLLDCANKMTKSDIGSLIVAEDGILLGILTEKDFVKKVVARNLDLKQTKAKEVMSTKMIKISPEMDLYDAILLMSREEKRRLPVTKGERIIGLLTYKDLLKIQPDLYDIFIENFKIREEETKRNML
jgi:signal-transduction protein with cAMP-binding, CBS, and nucleotidyltransferase domain